MKSSITVCPVPTEQQPLNEYEALKESWFYGIASKDLRGYITPMSVLWGLSWILTEPIAATSFSPYHAPLQFWLSAAAGALITPILLLIQLLVGWSYIRNRLSNATVSYEESGWYDGQTWIKPEEVLSRDRLIVSYQIEPILKRLKVTFGTLASCLLAAALGIFCT